MSTGKTGPANMFSQAVNAEIRALMARRSYSQTKLAAETGISQAQISKVIFRNEAPLNINQLDTIANVLGDDTVSILERATQALKLSEQYNAVDDYDLAAKSREARTRDVNEEDYL